MQKRDKKGRFPQVPELKVAKIRAMARAGHTKLDIAIETDVSEYSVYRYARHLLRAQHFGPPVNVGRLRRIVAAAADKTTPHELLARRFGLRDRKSFTCTVCYARRKLAEVEARSSENRSAA